MNIKMHRNHKTGLLLSLLLWAMLPLQGQVDICYSFEDATPNSRPLGWDALPNLDFHYVGISDALAHSGTKSLGNNGTTCFTIMPDEGLNYSADNVWLTFWYYLHLNTDFFEVGYLTDATNSSTFHVLDTVHGWQQQWHFFAVDLSSVPMGARIAFFGHDIFSGDGTFWLDDLHLTSQPCAAWGLHVAENRADSVRLEWQSVGNLPTLTITTNNGTYNPTGNSLTVPHQPNTTYTATLSTSFPLTACMPVQPYTEQVKVYAYQDGNCLDATDFNSSMATPYYGTYVNPYLHTGTYTNPDPSISGVFAGSHALNTTPGPDGGGMLVFPRTIPPGDNATLRLGNRLGDWESDAMLYTLTVDTNASDLLVMKYTVAMAFGTFQGPEEAHRSDTLHPAWFRIEMLDDNWQPTTDSCQLFYIDMWDTDGWDEMNGMYKRRDFTGIAFDLSPYHGRQLHLRVTATDGAVNNRWCYAYYNFSCLKRNDYSDACSTSDSLTFTMPYGFHYRWWKDGSTATLDTTQSITVAADSSLYHCQLTDRFNPACNTVVSRWALPQPQQWVNEEIVENDLPHTFLDGTFTSAVDTTFLLPSPSGCDTLLHYHLHVWPNQQVRVEHPVCPGDWPLLWEGYTFTSPDSVTLTLTDSHGADSTVTLVAFEAPTYEVNDTLPICPGNPFIYDGIDYGGPAVVDVPLTSQQGCDSLVHLSLLPRDSSFRPLAYYSDDHQIWHDSVPIVLCAGQTLYLLDSTDGATAWNWTLLTFEAQNREASFLLDTTLRGELLTLEVTSRGDCRDTLYWPVYVLPTPTADFAWTPEVPVDITPEARFINLSTPDSCYFRWEIQNMDGIDTLTVFEPHYRWPGDLPQGTFDVTLFAYHDSTFAFKDSLITHTCFDSVTHQVEIVTAWLQFPNLVTPNGDGTNDTWRVLNLLEIGQYPMNELWIYNRWGTLVYHVRNISQESDFWDPNLTHSPDGTYFFRFSAKSLHGLVRTNGNIEVIR